LQYFVHCNEGNTLVYVRKNLQWSMLKQVTVSKF
jgi:hypothetical protein